MPKIICKRGQARKERTKSARKEAIPDIFKRTQKAEWIHKEKNSSHKQNDNPWGNCLTEQPG